VNRKTLGLLQQRGAEGSGMQLQQQKTFVPVGNFERGPEMAAARETLAASQ